MRSRDKVCAEIAAATDAERGEIIKRIRAFDWPDERKQHAIRFVMLLGLAGGTSKEQ